MGPIISYLKQHDFILQTSIGFNGQKVSTSLTAYEISDDLNIEFERLDMKSIEVNKNGVNEDLYLLSGHFKGDGRNCDVIGHKARDFKNKNYQNGGNNGN
jgi:hypothetical protein